MRIHQRLFACFLAAVASCAAGQPLPGSTPTVDVYLPVVLRSQTAFTLLRARAVTTEIYATLGVRVLWHAGGKAPHGCAQQPMHSVVVVALSEDSPRFTQDHALAWANLYSRKGPCVTLLSGPLEAAIQERPLTAYLLLGHVLAHEIGHILEGIARHSETGLMVEHWSLEEIASMKSHHLEFAPNDAALILDSLHMTRAAN